MRRKNPNTGKPFQSGDYREDGRRFVQYNQTRLKADGFFVEAWCVPEKFIEREKRRRQSYKKNAELNQANRRQHHSAGRLYKAGDKHPEKDLYFIAYDRTKIDEDGFAREKWATEEQFEIHKNNSKAATAKKIQTYREIHKNLNPPKRTNPITKKLFKRGDTRPEDEMIFYAYTDTTVLVDGLYHGERWLTPDGYWMQNFTKMNSVLKARAKKKSLPYNLDSDYLVSIFPSDELCPVLGIKMEFGGNKRESPSLDRFIPEEGYTKGNVAWISGKANSMKSDASVEEIEKLNIWMKSFKK